MYFSLLILIFVFQVTFGAFARADNSLNNETKEKSIIIITERLDITEGAISNSKIGEGDILKNPSKTPAGIVNTLPNVERSGSIRGSNAEFKIRGLDDVRITTKIDGTKNNFRGEYKGRNFVSNFMLKEITVKMGANSVLDGSGAIAGSIDLKTKSVEDVALNENAKTGGEVFTSYSTNGNLQNYGGAAFARRDASSLLLMYNFTKNNDFKSKESKFLNINKFGDKIPYTSNTTNNAMLKFERKLSEREFVKASASFFSEVGENTTNPFRIAFAGDPVDKNLFNQRYNLELNLERFNIKSFIDKTDIKESIINGFRTDDTGFFSYGANVSSNFTYESVKKRISNTFIYGAEFVKDKQDAIREGDDRRSIYPNGESRNEGIYIQNAFKKGDFLILTGLRQDYYTLSSENVTKRHASNILKKAVLTYEFGNFLTPYVRYSEGYRAPLIKEVFASGKILTSPNFNLSLLSNYDLKPEYSKNYEVGFNIIKNDIFELESELSFNFNYFLQDIKDYIMQEIKCNRLTCSTGRPTTSYIFQYQNLSKVQMKGFETELKYISNTLFASVSYSQVSGYQKFNNNPLLQIPPKKFVVKLTRKFENGISVGFESISAASVKDDDLRRYVFESYINRPSALYLVDVNAERMQLAEITKGYSIVNLNLDYTRRVSNYESIIGININNVFNVAYKEQTSFIPGLSRSITLYVKVRF